MTKKTIKQLVNEYLDLTEVAELSSEEGNYKKNNMLVDKSLAVLRLITDHGEQGREELAQHMYDNNPRRAKAAAFMSLD